MVPEVDQSYAWTLLALVLGSLAMVTLALYGAVALVGDIVRMVGG